MVDRGYLERVSHSTITTVLVWGQTVKMGGSGTWAGTWLVPWQELHRYISEMRGIDLLIAYQWYCRKGPCIMVLVPAGRREEKGTGIEAGDGDRLAGPALGGRPPRSRGGGVALSRPPVLHVPIAFLFSYAKFFWEGYTQPYA